MITLRVIMTGKNCVLAHEWSALPCKSSRRCFLCSCVLSASKRLLSFWSTQSSALCSVFIHLDKLLHEPGSGGCLQRVRPNPSSQASAPWSSRPLFVFPAKLRLPSPALLCILRPAFLAAASQRRNFSTNTDRLSWAPQSRTQDVVAKLCSRSLRMAKRLLVVEVRRIPHLIECRLAVRHSGANFTGTSELG